MNRNELMIGDWVIAQPDEDICGEGVGTIVDRITEIYDVEGVMSVTLEDFDYPVAVGLLDPFLLTEEILKKNFEENIPGIGFVYKLGKCYIASLEDDNSFYFGLLREDRKNGTMARYPLVRIKWVHQLQHALKLCGIDKEIVL